MPPPPLASNNHHLHAPTATAKPCPPPHPESLTPPDSDTLSATPVRRPCTHTTAEHTLSRPKPSRETGAPYPETAAPLPLFPTHRPNPSTQPVADARPDP